MAQTFVRREIWSLEAGGALDPITLAYAKAVQAMQARPSTDPTSWRFQAAIHGSYARPPAGADWNQCQHQGWFFLPWHRMYLYFFERIVRAAVTAAGGPSDFAIPYWDYGKPFPNNTIPRGFRTALLPDGTTNPLSLASPRRSAALMRGGQLAATVTTSANAMSQTQFTSRSMGFGGGMVGPQHFGDFANTGALEATPHNTIHVALVGANPVGQCRGGLMIDPNCAALDPIFWLHHGNIDRLWNDWIASGGGRANPPPGPWRSASFTFYDENGSEVTMTAAEVLDTASQLGYVYDNGVALDEMASLPPDEEPQPESPPELVAASEEPFTLAGRSADVTVAAPEDTHALLRSAAAPGPRRVLVSVDDIKAEVNPGVVYGVYLNVADGADSLKYHIGNLALFGIEKMNDPDTRHDGAPGFRHIFDATSVAEQLAAEGRWDPSAVTVTFEPATVLPPPGEEDTWDPGEEAKESVPPVEIGRVSLFVA
jgi:tyrosinase-like protein/polyphenol oxidase-like protein